LPDVYELSKRFRKKLDDRDVTAMRQLARLYAPVLKRLDAEIKQAIDDLWGKPTQGRVTKILRLRRLRDVIASEVRTFAESATALIVEAQDAGLAAGLEHSLVQIKNAASVIGISGAFGEPNINALRELIGVLADGSPVPKLLNGYGKEAGRIATTVLLRGLGKGENPNRVARELHIRMQMPLRRAQMVSRTEMLRAFRSASLATYRENSDVVKGWVWLSAANSRTCPVCWAMHGTFHPLEERFASHIACRCTQVPAVRGAPQIVNGTELFRELPDADKRSILGPSKYQAYTEGRLQITDLVAKGRSATWGNYRREKTLKELRLR
jgi:SPP1 gp7 family putative phage head morphogenesis protein